MKEVKSPKKPLIYYYGIALLIVFLFNMIVSPLLMRRQIVPKLSLRTRKIPRSIPPESWRIPV